MMAWLIAITAAVVGAVVTVGLTMVLVSSNTSQGDECQQTWNSTNTIIANSGGTALQKQQEYTDAEYAYYCCEDGLGYDPDTQECVGG